MRQNIIALVYDFDGTLTPKMMQEYTVFPRLKLNPDKFTVWLRIMINNHFKYFKNYENNGL